MVRPRRIHGGGRGWIMIMTVKNIRLDLFIKGFLHDLIFTRIAYFSI